MKATPSLSPSALSEYLTCQRRYYYRYVLGEEEGPGEYRGPGIFYHEALANLVRTGTVDYDAAVATVRGAKDFGPYFDFEGARAEVVANLDRVRTQLLPHISPEWIESKVRSREGWVGRLDLLSAWTPFQRGPTEFIHAAGRCVIDWKIKHSSKGRRTQSSATDSPQLALYALLANVRAAAFCEIPRNLNAPLNLVTATYDEYALGRWRRYFTEQFGALRAVHDLPEGGFALAPVGHPLCCPRYCPFWRRCPGGEGASS